jgi:hypothetical protein
VQLEEGFDVGEWLGGGWADKNMQTLTSPWCAPTLPFRRDGKCYAVGFTGTAPVAVSCAIAGDADAYPTITYTGIVNNPKVTDAYGHSSSWKSLRPTPMEQLCWCSTRKT